MAATAPMRDGPPAGSGTGGDSRVTTTSASSAAAATTTTNFEYDDNEWDIGIGNLIIDLDADIEKTNEKSNNVGNLVSGGSGASMAAASTTNVASGGSGSGSKTNKGSSSGGGSSGSASSGSGGGGSSSGGSSSSAVEHSSMVENKSLKMKIKRTKSGSKSSEKHEIVKPSEQNGGEATVCNSSGGGVSSDGGKGSSSSCKHSISGGSVSGSVNSNVGSTNASSGGGSASNSVNNVSNKRGSSSHRRDKTKDKHPQSGDKAASKSSSSSSSTSSSSSSSSTSASTNQSSTGSNQGSGASASGGSTNSIGSADLNGIVRTPLQRVMYPMQTNGPGPPNASGPPPSPSKEQQPSKSVASSPFASNAIPTTCATSQTSSAAQVTATSVASNAAVASAAGHNQAAAAAAVISATTIASAVNQAAVENGNSTCSSAGNAGATSTNSVYISTMEESLSRPQSPSSPPCKKVKTANCLINDSKETKDACIGTSISTMTEPDCLGPCEPGTSVTLEGIVWHETEGVLVVNVTWRGKTYVGTLLDCTRHDWAPPRFCDSPTSDLDARLPKSRAKRGRAATNDLSNFTETRSSVHSKLRSSSNGSNKGARKGLSNSPTPFVSPRPDSGSGGSSGSSKRKNRPSEDESASPQANGKKSKSSSQSAPLSPPSSPIFFECPEANCCKKYKHLNGLKYHQSHAHGNSCAADDDDTTKESGSMSENEEMPSPADQQSIKCGERKDAGENSESEPATPISEATGGSLNLPSSPHHTQPGVGVTSLADIEPVAVERSPPPVDNKTVVKPGVLRYGVVPTSIDEIGSTSSSATTSVKLTTTSSTSGLRPITTASTNALPPLTLNSTASQSTSPSPPSISQQVPLSPSAASSSTLPLSFATTTTATQSMQSTQSLPLQATVGAKLPQFNVKPASALMQEDKVKDKSNKCQQQSRKKSRKSPGGSPHSHPIDQSQYKVSESSGREEVRSPAYSDISDDGAPVLEPELADTKNKPLPMDKKTLESSGAHSPHAMQHFGMYSYYGQPPFLVPSVQPDAKAKDEKGVQDSKHSEKEKKESELQQQKLLPPHFYPYDSYVPNYGYNLSQNYPIPMVQSSNSEKDIKEENKSPGPTDLVKQPTSSVHQSPNVGQYPASMGAKSKVDSTAKMQTEPYGSLKDGPDSRSPLNVSSAYLHSRPSPQQQSSQQPLQQMQQMQPIQAHSQQPNIPHSQSQQMSSSLPPSHHLSQAHQQQQQQHEDMRRYYSGMYPDQRRKESQHTSHSEAPLKATPPPSSMNAKSSLSSLSSSKHCKDKQQMMDDKKDDKVKQEGVKPTMETQGPPPPPTSSYAYFHSGYLQSPYVPFDPAHPMYRTMNPMIVPAGPYGNSPYLHHPAQMHPQITRYHAPEDLSRPPSGSATKALDLLHHQASQYYPSSHKIHELQERAIKSPTPKVSTTIASPSTAPNGQPSALSTAQMTPTSTSDRLSSGVSSQSGKVPSVDGKDSRSPPPQRHVHTHHHTHVGLGYPLLPGQYAPPYGAAVLASEQAAAVASAGSNPYSPK